MNEKVGIEGNVSKLQDDVEGLLLIINLKGFVWFTKEHRETKNAYTEEKDLRKRVKEKDTFNLDRLGGSQKKTKK